MIAAVSSHWNHVTNSGAGMVAPAELSSTLLLNTRQMDTVKYAPTTAAILSRSIRGESSGGAWTEVIRKRGRGRGEDLHNNKRITQRMSDNVRARHGGCEWIDRSVIASSSHRSQARVPVRVLCRSRRRAPVLRLPKPGRLRLVASFAAAPGLLLLLLLPSYALLLASRLAVQVSSHSTAHSCGGGHDDEHGKGTDTRAATTIGAAAIAAHDVSGLCATRRRRTQWDTSAVHRGVTGWRGGGEPARGAIDTQHTAAHREDSGGSGRTVRLR